MTPNGPKTFLRGIIHDYMTYWTTLGPFQRPTWPQWSSEKAPWWSIMTSNHVMSETSGKRPSSVHLWLLQGLPCWSVVVVGSGVLVAVLGEELAMYI